MTDMTQLFLFPESGSIRGVPGTFAGQAVALAPDGSFTVLPLPRHPHFSPASGEAEQETSEKVEEEDL